MGLIENAMEGQARYQDFLFKALFTAITLSGGFKGGIHSSGSESDGYSYKNGGQNAGSEA